MPNSAASKPKPRCSSRRIGDDRAFRARGHLTISGFLRGELRWSQPQVTARRQLARLVDQVPVVIEHLAAGRSVSPKPTRSGVRRRTRAAVTSSGSCVEVLLETRTGVDVPGLHGEFGAVGTTRRHRRRPPRRRSQPRQPAAWAVVPRRRRPHRRPLRGDGLRGVLGDLRAIPPRRVPHRLASTRSPATAKPMPACTWRAPTRNAHGTR